MKQRSISRDGWGPGDWEKEPDRVEFRVGGLPALIVRNHSGALCGYVGVPPGHPYYECSHDDVLAGVHGGLTYSASCNDDGAICHVPTTGEPDAVWWFGFDCGHCTDIAPGIAADMRKHGLSHAEYPGARYRNVAYVLNEIIKLAEFLKAAQAVTP